MASLPTVVAGTFKAVLAAFATVAALAVLATFASTAGSFAAFRPAVWRLVAFLSAVVAGAFELASSTIALAFAQPLG